MTQPEISVFHWNPRYPLRPGKLWRALPLRRRVNNFGDLLGPVIVDLVRQRLGLTGVALRSGQLMSVGSILHLAPEGAVVWGSGINGKVCVPDDLGSRQLDIRAVRGPQTRRILLRAGIDCPEVYGDPGRLTGLLMPELHRLSTRYDVTIVPNFNDWSTAHKGTHHVLDPRSPLTACLTTIAQSRLVVGSSLHAIIVAESLGRRAALLRSDSEPLFKFRDYYEGTGRTDFQVFDTIEEAVRHADPLPVPEWDIGALLDSFPRDLWAPS